jgi:gas vesicle protein
VAPIGGARGETGMSRQDSNGGTVLLAFLAGAISGAAVALLFAPASGDETRQFLSDKARESRERALSAAREGRDAVRRHKEHLQTAVERGREAYNKARHGEETA